MADVLIYGAPEASPDLFHAIPVGIGDPFLYAEVDGRRIAIFRLLDGFAAIDAHCPHAAGPLADGIVADSCVTCPLHERRFDLVTGAALNGPEEVAVHELRVEEDEIWVRIA